MRVTAEVKAETRRRISKAARDRFAKVGFEAATTRDIAAAAGIAAGTLFNYFAAKEAIAVALVAEPVRLAFRWRPMLPDADDDMVLETAVNGRADAIARRNGGENIQAPKSAAATAAKMAGGCTTNPGVPGVKCPVAAAATTNAIQAKTPAMAQRRAPHEISA